MQKYELYFNQPNKIDKTLLIFDMFNISESENRMIPGLLFSTHLSLYLFTFLPFYL